MRLESFARFPSLCMARCFLFISRPRNLALKDTVGVCGCFFRTLLSVMEYQAMKQMLSSCRVFLLYHFLERPTGTMYVERIYSKSVASFMFYASTLSLDSSLEHLLFLARTRRVIYKYCIFLYPYLSLLWLR